MARRRRRKPRRPDREQPDMLHDAGLDGPEGEALEAEAGTPDAGEDAAEIASGSDEPGETGGEHSRATEPEEAAGEEQPLPPAAPAPPAGEASPEEPAPAPPTPAADWPRRVAALEDLRDVEGALEVVRSERSRVPDDIPLLVAEIRILGTLGRFDAALAPLAELRRAAGEAPLVHLVAGVLHFRRGMYPEAEAELRTLTDSEEPAARPYRGEANYYLGESLNRMERVEEALEILRTAIELTPHDPRPYHTLGRLLDRKGAPDEAAVMYRRAREAERAGKTQ